MVDSSIGYANKFVNKPFLEKRHRPAGTHHTPPSLKGIVFDRGDRYKVGYRIDNKGYFELVHVEGKVFPHGEQNGFQKYCAYEKYALRDDGTAYGISGNNTYDWFEALYESTCDTCAPSLMQTGQSDGGTYPHLPNLLETLVDGGGGWIFLLADDDNDTNVFHSLAPVSDGSTSTNGSPDYDVNGDGALDVGVSTQVEVAAKTKEVNEVDAGNRRKQNAEGEYEIDEAIQYAE